MRTPHMQFRETEAQSGSSAPRQLIGANWRESKRFQSIRCKPELNAVDLPLLRKPTWTLQTWTTFTHEADLRRRIDRDTAAD
jgi:hypothetical protein